MNSLWCIILIIYCMTGKHCSKCRKAVKGHVGPCGQNCPSMSDTEEHETRPEQEPEWSRALMDEVKKLALTVKDLQQHLPTSSTSATLLPSTTSGASDIVVSTTTPSIHLAPTAPLAANGPSDHMGASASTHLPPAATFPADSGLGAPIFSTHTSNPQTILIPETIRAQAINGEFINFHELAKIDKYCDKYKMGSEAELKKLVNIDNFTDWLNVWNVFEILLMGAPPTPVL